MANYVSSLTGSQIDSVMQKIDQGVPEGWAVGEKNGVPVSSSSVYYHNNAKYYATNAQASAARAEAAVPASTAGAVFFDRSQSLTDAQMRQARTNIGAGNTNPNLLVNWWWGDGVINSRGVTSGTNFSYGTYRMDRWYTSFGTSANAGSWSLGEDGLTITTTTSAEYFGQRLPFKLTNQVVTASVLLAGGEIVSGTTTLNSSNKNWNLTSGLACLMKSYDEFFVYAGNDQTFTIKAIKLELNSASTLANDTKPDPNAELIKCVTSTVDPNDKYANRVVTATSNPNLLDNWWFVQGARVNQRGVYSYPSVSSATYCIDRWLYNRATISVNDAGLAFAWNGVDGENGNIHQFTGRDLRNKLLTCSAVIGGTLYSHTFYFTGSSSITYDFMVSGVKWRWQLDHSAGAASGATSTRLVLSSFDTTARTISRMKLETGAASTLLLDAPPSYAEELAKCQRFFVRVKSAGDDGMYPVGFGRTGGDGTTARIAIPVPVQMRAKPTIAINGTYNLACNGTNTALTGLTTFAATAGSVIVTATGTFSANQPCILSTSSVNNYLNFSADI